MLLFLTAKHLTAKTELQKTRQRVFCSSVFSNLYQSHLDEAIVSDPTQNLTRLKNSLQGSAKSVNIAKAEEGKSERVTSAMVAHRTLNPLVLGSSPRSPI